MRIRPPALLSQLGVTLSRRWATVLLTLTILGAAVSCRTVTRHVVVLPQVPDAKYIGTKECAQCHEDICRDFVTADHARLIADGPNALSAGCESCHGPGSLHSDSGGETKPPFSFSAGRPQTASFSGPLAKTPARSVENMCFTCHGNVRGQFSLPSHHPVPEGHMTCTSCHNPHKGGIMTSTAFTRQGGNESCLKCHPNQRGPFVFEHEASREGCLTCHSPHGSVNARMLVTRDSNLCTKCHFQQVKPGGIAIGGVNHSGRMAQGSCWSASCHEAVHGSRANSSLRF